MLEDQALRLTVTENQSPYFFCNHFVKNLHYLEFFWFAFSRIGTEYGEIQFVCGKYGPENLRIMTLFTHSIVNSNLVLFGGVIYVKQYFSDKDDEVSS